MTIYNREDYKTALPQIEKKIETNIAELSSAKEELTNLYKKIYDVIGDIIPIVLDALVVEEHSFNYSSIPSGGDSGVQSVTFSKEGYYPIGVVGFRTGESDALPTRYKLSARDNGECTFEYFLRAVASVSASTGYVDILWIKGELNA